MYCYENKYDVEKILSYIRFATVTKDRKMATLPLSYILKKNTLAIAFLGRAGLDSMREKTLVFYFYVRKKLIKN